jgi:hypothetical protein
VLRSELVSETSTELRFKRDRVLRVLPCSARTTRGFGACYVGLDEFGLFLTDTEGPRAANRIWAAVSPSLAQYAGEGRMVVTSTPGDESGLFETLYLKAEAGELPGAVAWTASTIEANPSIDSEFLRSQELALGPDAYAREYEGRFLPGGGRFFDPDELRTVVAPRRESLPDDGRDWVCALDPASGGGDPFACVVVGRDAREGYRGRLLVGHVERWTPRRGKRVLLRGRAEKTLWVDAVLDRVAEIAKRFRARVVSDQHIPDVIKEELQGRGLRRPEILAWSASNRGEAFQALRARVATERIELVSNEQLLSELSRVRNRFRSGSSNVEIPRAGDSHGDLALALAAGVYVLDRRGSGRGASLLDPSDIMIPPVAGIPLGESPLVAAARRAVYGPRPTWAERRVVAPIGTTFWDPSEDAMAPRRR